MDWAGVFAYQKTTKIIILARNNCGLNNTVKSFEKQPLPIIA